MTIPRTILASALGLLAVVSLAVGQPGGDKKPPMIDDVKFPAPPTILDPESRPIDLDSALHLAGVRNPEILFARERVIEATALRQLAAAQFLPSINAGTNLDHHNG